MALRVAAPLAGTVVSLEDVPDEVFSQRIMGPGLAVMPDADAGVLDVVAPCDGVLAKVHPHAVAIDAGATGVLVHLGIDTVTLHGRGFEVLVADGERVTAGQLLIRWDVAVAREADLPVVTPVVVFEMRDLQVHERAPLGHRVVPGDDLLDLVD